MRKRSPPQEQGSLFQVRPQNADSPNAKASPKRAVPAARRWQMPALGGSTVAEIRLRWKKRLTPAQAARVEAELAALAPALTQLGFGAVQVERAFVRRRKR